MFVCKRCGLDFKEKRILVPHLKRKIICMPLENDISPQVLLDELNKKEGLECKNCKRVYKNENSLRAHNCKNKDIGGLLLKKIDNLEKEIKQLKDKPVNTTNIHNTNNNTINNNLNVTLNCFMDTTNKPIEYLLNNENIKQKILNWVKSKKGLLEYIDEKFYNPEHPENMLIKRGDNGENIKLHIRGKWKQLNNIKASDLILTNVGNDFMVYMDTIKEDEEDYEKNKKLLKKFENDIMKPLEWGLEISEDSENLITKTIIKNKDGQYVYLEDEIEKDRKLEITNNVILHIHSKDLIDL